MRNDDEIEVPVEEVEVGDTVIVRSGEKISVDGIVVDGHSFIKESMITGKSVPSRKMLETPFQRNNQQNWHFEVYSTKSRKRNNSGADCNVDP